MGGTREARLSRGDYGRILGQRDEGEKLKKGHGGG